LSASTRYILFYRRKDLIRGAEVPMMVVFTDFLKGPHNDDFFSRCTSSLIVVCNEEAADKILSFKEGCEFAYKIPVHGK
jgi:hypothetical protein